MFILTYNLEMSFAYIWMKSDNAVVPNLWVRNSNTQLH